MAASAITSQDLNPQTLLFAPVNAVVGENAIDVVGALAQLGIKSVFDLATSQAFEAAAIVSQPATDADDRRARVFRQIGRMPKDLLDKRAEGASLEEIARMPIAALQGIGPKAAAGLAHVIHADRIADLAAWEPYRVARGILEAAYADSVERTAENVASGADDARAVRPLLPAVGTYPTERVQYASFLLERLLSAGPESLMPIADAEPLDLADPSLASAALRPATGAVLTFTQSWYPKALALGQLLHTVALAPGETTRVALIDWSHGSMTAAGEEISETEAVSATVARTRAISEVTNAVADEVQEGRSTSAAAGLGFLSGTAGGASLPVGPASIGLGASGGIGASLGGGASWASSKGHRTISADMTQHISDRTQQAANASRNRRATLIREVSEQDSEKLETRALTNYNHMHALTVEYFEVVHLYHVISALTKAERCLFLPIKPINFRDPAVVGHYRTAIAGAGLTQHVRQLVTVPPDHMLFRVPLRTTPWSADLLAKLRALKGEPVGDANSDSLVIPDCEIAEISWQFGALKKATNPGTVRIVDRDGSEHTLPIQEHVRDPNRHWYSCTIGERVSSVTLEDPDPRNFALTIKLHTPPEAIYLRPGPLNLSDEATEFVLLESAPTITSADLTAQLEENRDHYTHAIWATASRSALETLLSRLSYEGPNGDSLLEQVDPIPLAVSGNYLLFRFPVPDDDPEWKAFLTERGIVVGHENETHVPLPSSGVFAEAILGRANSAEKLDITRFWNWQDSPIPLTAPEIAALQAGQHTPADPGQPGQLGQPMINLVNAPALPDATGLAAALAALGSANMFRDMSGLAGTQQMTSAALAQAVGAAVKGAEQAGKALESVAKSNISAAGAKINEGAKLDEQTKRAGTGGTGGTDGAAPAAAGSTPRQSHEAAAFESTLLTDGEGPGWVYRARPDGSIEAASGPTGFVGQAVPAVLTPQPAAATASDPITNAQALANRHPDNDRDCAKWIVDAYAQGFITATPTVNSQWAALANGNTVSTVVPKPGPPEGDTMTVTVTPSETQTTLGHLITLEALVRKSLERWLALNNAAAAKDELHVSNVFFDTGPYSHSQGHAVDIDRIGGWQDATAVLRVLNDLPTATALYGIGLPFRDAAKATFYDPADGIDAKEEAAKTAAGTDSTPADVTDALVNGRSGLFSSTWDVATNDWQRTSNAQPGGQNQSYTKLKSSTLKTKAASLTAAQHWIYPDKGIGATGVHLHLHLRDTIQTI